MCFCTINLEDYYLPKDLIAEILSRLPITSLLRFKSVCKSWRDLIKTREFTKLHLKQSKESNSGGMITLFTNNTNLCTLNYHHPNTQCSVKLDSPTFLDYFTSPWNELGPPVLVGSCNGLICFAIPTDRYVMYNPSTRVFKELPKVTRTNLYGFRVFSYLAYDDVNDDYKVIEVFHYNEDYRHDNILGAECLIFSMKSNTWKTIDTNVPYYKHNFIVKNNSLRWVDWEAMLIRSFDFFSERYDIDLKRPVPSNSTGLVKRSRTGDVQGDFDMLIVGADNLETEFVSWTSYGRCTTLPIVRSKEGGRLIVFMGFDGITRRVIGWSGIVVAEDRFPGLCYKWETFISAKQWVESLVSLE